MPSPPDSTPPPELNRFAPADLVTPLAREIAASIRETGPITFAAFMERALYDERLGYYRSGRSTVGREGDYLTSPEVHPLFGAAVAATTAGVWEAMGEPARFTLVEVGPGSGALMADVLAWSDAQRPEFGRALRGVLVERSEEARAQQQRRLAYLGARVSWVAALGEVAPIAGVVVANELLDAQPVHRMRWSDEGGAWEELFVGLSGSETFIDVPEAVSQSGLLAPLTGIEPADGQVVEVCPGLPSLVNELATALGAGALLLFDYGYGRERLYASWRGSGTLMTFHRHTPGEEPYVRVGEQDMTCHVDVDTVCEAAEGAGLAAYPTVSQADWLRGVGAASTPPVGEGGRGAEMESYLSRRRAVETLSDPGGLGRIQVMAFARGGLGALPGLPLESSGDR